eukprot:scaffold1237_cov243-Pinguiococcus_pyrenoidosus.AAC.5
MAEADGRRERSNLELWAFDTSCLSAVRPQLDSFETTQSRTLRGHEVFPVFVDLLASVLQSVPHKLPIQLSPGVQYRLRAALNCGKDDLAIAAESVGCPIKHSAFIFPGRQHNVSVAPAFERRELERIAALFRSFQHTS